MSRVIIECSQNDRRAEPGEGLAGATPIVNTPRENHHEHQHNEPVITSYAQAPARTVTAGGVTYAYRELGPKGGVPVVFFVHLAATLDNWDPRIIDPIAEEPARHHLRQPRRRRLDRRPCPTRIEAMADDAFAFITALGFDKVDVFSFSLGGMVAQALVVKHPELVRKLILTGTGPPAGRTSTRSPASPTGTCCAPTLTRSDPKEFLFFNRNATGKPAAKAFVERLKERTVDRDKPITDQGVPDPAEGDQAVGPLGTRGPVDDHPAHPDRQRRQRPDGALGRSPRTCTAASRAPS